MSYRRYKYTCKHCQETVVDASVRWNAPQKYKDWFCKCGVHYLIDIGGTRCAVMEVIHESRNRN